MTIAGYRSQNHPQQTRRRGADHDTDDRGTTAELFDPLHAVHAFTLDVAAAPHNAKVPRYFTRDDNGLAQSWAGEHVWCNPPYSDVASWVRKAWREAPGCPVIVMLLPANRCEQRWWQDLVEPYRDRPGSALRTRFLAGRRRFHRPGAVIGPKGDRPPFGNVLLTWESCAPTIAPDLLDEVSR